MTEYANPSAELRARVALEKHRFHNTHSLGQNFLLSESLLEHLLDEAALAPEDCVLEIGPGAGLMTALMARRCKRVLAVELDSLVYVCCFCKKHFNGLGNSTKPISLPFAKRWASFSKTQITNSSAHPLEMTSLSD